jgi:hypothetical protein
VVAFAERLDRRFDDEIWRSEIRLADAKIDNVAALRGQGIGAGEHRERVFLADAVEGRDSTKHDCCPRQAPAARSRGVPHHGAALQPISQQKSNGTSALVEKGG